MGRLVRSWIVAAVCLCPTPALACAVCFDATDENRRAFLDTTIFLTVLPLVLIFGGGYWIYRQTTAPVPG
ncbi:MAG TPA: hypothetical protein ENK18_10540 [Deltaproteobacteria bacterium]|nr:hypothetical protein [Deltaproteobacteria bacterium]